MSLTSNNKYGNTKILTETEKYSVTKLSTDLSFLPGSNGNNNTIDTHHFEGLVDTALQKALVNDLDHIYIWNYNSIQKDTPICKISLHDDYSVLSSPPICLFTSSISSTNNDTANYNNNASGNINSGKFNNGICIINKKNSQFLYFEDISTINNLYTKLSKSKAHVLDLKLKDNENITSTINCEPSGIIIATSLGRVLFITIKDSTGKPKLELKQQLIKPQNSFFFRNLDSSKEIISLKKGPIVGKGERLLYITTRGGSLQIWQLSINSKSFKRLEINIYEHVLDSLQDLYPFAHGTLAFLDSHPIYSDTSSAHLTLASISNGNEIYYLMITVILDEKTNSFQIFSIYKLNTYFTKSTVDLNHKPQLFIPNALDSIVSPTLSVYVLFNNAVVMTQISSKLDSSFPLRRKWEDIIRFNKDVEIIGSGYSTDSIYVICKDMGVLKIASHSNNNQEGHHHHHH
uniref:Nucleoporin NUP133 n=1 Tax=Vanderwaltozyma polyspora (strain ATCC 22028 / DSM 70294 / BCRC 21397 / CBS 2163 / NBRC 10782 / NRRL Y-8283 / UCD 57-17) TaxID=436907 RepID=UPI00046208EB